MPFRLSLLCTLLPLFSVHLTWLTGTWYGNLAFCVPYWSDCHSISATGRHYPEKFIFLASFIVLAVLMAGYWLLVYRWLSLTSEAVRITRLLTILGLIACVALIVYTVTLGIDDSLYALARRIGAVVYFAFTSFAHLLVVYCLIRKNAPAFDLQAQKHYLTVCCAVLVSAAIVSALLGALWQGWDAWENAFEWGYALIMISLFLCVGTMWRATGFEIHFRLNSTED